MALASRRIAGRILRYSLFPRATAARYATIGEDRMSGEYPRTPEERAAAARKYNMRVEDYQPHPEDGFGWGDYPKIPTVHEDDKDPDGDWDFPEQRRDYGETPHVDYEFLARNKAPVYLEDYIPLWKQSLALGGVLLALGAIIVFGHNVKLFQPVAPKQYPFNGLSVEKGLGPYSPENAPKHYKF